jgi:hypothetical protein
MTMGRMKLLLGDVFDAGNQITEEGVFFPEDDPRNDEWLEESLERFEDMLRDVEPQTMRAYGMPRVSHGPVVDRLDRW